MSRALGRYELLRPLARGGMAEVYLARRRAAGVEKWLVVKRMRRERAGDARFLDLFVREAKLSMSLVHQNIVPVFDFGRIDDQVFIAMERVEGRDLGSSLSHAGRAHPLPPVLAAFVAAECCQALDYAHRRRGPDGTALGIVHRDVTPRNVLLSWSGEVKLTDFGIASLAGEDGSRVIGTPAYMAPEQARGEVCDPRADLYAVGLVLREALTGERARRGDDRDGTLAAARANELAPWPDGVVPALRAIADRATASDRDARYPDARAMLEELDAFIIGERSANKDERRAPARQLGAWLAEVWVDASDEVSGDDGIAASELVSFMDDGALDVIGTGTERSMQATAADDGDAKTIAKTPLPGTPTQVPAKLETPQPESFEAAERRRRPLAAIAIGIAGLVVGTAALVAMMSASTADHQQPGAPPNPAPPPRPPVARVDPQPAVKPPVQVDPARPVQVDPAPRVPVDPPRVPVDPPRVPVDPPQPAHSDHPPAGSDARASAPKHPPRVPVHRPTGELADAGVPAPAVATKHKLQINSRPWANVTIDGSGGEQETPHTVELAPGPHRFHFVNPQLGLERDVSYTMPDGDDRYFIDLQK